MDSELLSNKIHHVSNRMDVNYRHMRAEGLNAYNTLFGYSGEWRCGMREGFGVMVYSKDQTYEGEWVRNKRHGWGRMSYSDGGYYEVIQHNIQLPYN